MKILYLVLILCILSGCTVIKSPPSNIQNYDANNILNYNFADLADSCTLHQNISLVNNSYCLANEREAFVFYDNLTNWNLFCCDFSTACFNETYTNVDDICVWNMSSYSGYTYQQGNNLVAFCCDENGMNCYVDSDVNQYDANTVCDMNYTLSVFSLNYNMSWDAMCCKGGIQ